MRLAIDPFPVLLMDEDILYRCFDSMTEPYSSKFANEYIGETTLEQYKTTDSFLAVRESFLEEEKKTEAVFDVLKHHYIDTTKYNEIKKQFHLLNEEDIVATLIACNCDKATQIYVSSGLFMYFTNRKTNRTAMSWKGEHFKQFKESPLIYNQKYDEAYISVFYCKGACYFAEHNELLTEDDINGITETLKKWENN